MTTRRLHIFVLLTLITGGGAVGILGWRSESLASAVTSVSPLAEQLGESVVTPATPPPEEAVLTSVGDVSESIVDTTMPTPEERAPRRKPRVLGAGQQTSEETVRTKQKPEVHIPTVPFFSQFTDISAPEWRTVGCGVASLGMLIEHYQPGATTVDRLLSDGIAARAYLDNAGWIHAGLIDLARQHNLTGQSVSLSHLSPTAALNELTAVLSVGPVMASVHYTFEPTNPIPHLVVITGIADGLVHYNDPAEAAGGGTISVEKFLRAWKQRYIEIRPT